MDKSSMSRSSRFVLTILRNEVFNCDAFKESRRWTAEAAVGAHGDHFWGCDSTEVRKQKSNRELMDRGN